MGRGDARAGWERKKDGEGGESWPVALLSRLLSLLLSLLLLRLVPLFVSATEFETVAVTMSVSRVGVGVD